jgi:hypothetical protein
MGDTSDPQCPRTRPKVRPISITPQPLPYSPPLFWPMTGSIAEEAEEVFLACEIRQSG